MGGSLFKKLGFDVERKSTDEFFNIQNEVSKIIENIFNTKVKPIKFYRNKVDHGDCDLIVLNDGGSNFNNIKNILENQFGFCHKNHNIYSITYKKFQVDIILHTKNIFDFCSYFYDYDPVGNLVGKIAHKFGLKFGFDGLFYPVRGVSNSIIENILISRDPEKIYTFLGFDFNIYKNGFDTLEDIFNFIINSKYFNKEIFLYENLSLKDRKRNKRRKSYNLFLDFINSKSDLKSFNFNKNKSIYIDCIEQYFPESNLKEKLKIINEKNYKIKLVKEKFNGNIVMRITGLKDEKLGKFLYDFRNQFKNQDLFNDYILSTSNEKIINDILDFYKKFINL